MNRLTPPHERAILTVSLLFLAFALLLSGRAWLYRATAPAPRPHAVLRVTLPGIDIGADAWPAQVGAAGYIELWTMPDTADDIQPFLRLSGAPALPQRPRPVRPHQAPQLLA